MYSAGLLHPRWGYYGMWSPKCHMLQLNSMWYLSSANSCHRIFTLSTSPLRRRYSGGFVFGRHGNIYCVDNLTLLFSVCILSINIFKSNQDFTNAEPLLPEQKCLTFLKSNKMAGITQWVITLCMADNRISQLHFTHNDFVVFGCKWSFTDAESCRFVYFPWFWNLRS